jgi:predicted outer membrane repeat protein
LDFYVAKTGLNTGNCLVDPCLTITYAMTQTMSGDRIHIAAGIYAENLILLNKNLSFYGAGMNATILDGGGLNPVIYSEATTTLTITDLTIRNGNAIPHYNGYGGGISNWGGALTLSRVKLTGNLAKYGGGIYSTGALTMTDCVVSANNANFDTSSSGGGLFLSADAVAVNLINVTISGNTATGYSGGIHYNQGSGGLNLTNVTISGNTAKYNGAISTNSGNLNLLNSTIATNHFSSGGSNGGIGTYGTINFKNTILAGNDGTNCFIGSGGSLVSQGYNLDSGSSCTLNSSGDLHNTDPVLGPLADNGGPTQTHALLLASVLHARSPAIDTGTNSGCPATDARGVARPQGTHCDMGAYEVRIYSIYLPLVKR